MAHRERLLKLRRGHLLLLRRGAHDKMSELDSCSFVPTRRALWWIFAGMPRAESLLLLLLLLLRLLVGPLQRVIQISGRQRSEQRLTRLDRIVVICLLSRRPRLPARASNGVIVSRWSVRLLRAGMPSKFSRAIHRPSPRFHCDIGGGGDTTRSQREE